MYLKSTASEVELTIPVEVFPYPTPGTSSAVENEATAGEARKTAGRKDADLRTACCATRVNIVPSLLTW